MIDGKSISRSLREILNESSTSAYIDAKTSYDYLYKAAQEFIKRTTCCTTTQSITTVASQEDYNLNSNFMGLYLQDDRGEFFIRYSDGTTTLEPLFKPYAQVIYDNDETETSQPHEFTIFDDPTNFARITGTTTSAGASSAGEATLTDSAAPFANVNDGDTVHNTSDGSMGVVLSKTSSSALVCALFDGTDDDWTNGDAYVIQPQNRFMLRMVPVPSTAGHTITVYHIERPAPVYSDYGIYRIPQEHEMALVLYASWLYKYRDSEPNFGDNFYQYFERETVKAGYVLNKTLNREKSRTSFKNRVRYGGR